MTASLAEVNDKLKKCEEIKAQVQPCTLHPTPHAIHPTVITLHPLSHTHTLTPSLSHTHPHTHTLAGQQARPGEKDRVAGGPSLCLSLYLSLPPLSLSLSLSASLSERANTARSLGGHFTPQFFTPQPSIVYEMCFNLTDFWQCSLLTQHDLY